MLASKPPAYTPRSATLYIALARERVVVAQAVQQEYAVYEIELVGDVASIRCACIGDQMTLFGVTYHSNTIGMDRY